MRFALFLLLVLTSTSGAETAPSAGEAELQESLTKVMKALPDALKLGDRLSTETIQNVRRALEESTRTKTEPQSAQQQVAETETLLLHIEALTKQLGVDVLNKVNRTVQELNAMSEEIN